MSSGPEKMEVHFEGHVQGVGFRYTTRGLAAQFDVVGYVMNLPDGRVRMVSVGEPGENQRLLQAIRQRMETYIRSEDVTYSSSTEEFSGFEIRHR